MLPAHGRMRSTREHERNIDEKVTCLLNVHLRIGKLLATGKQRVPSKPTGESIHE
jgi:hypothetical protein